VPSRQPHECVPGLTRGLRHQIWRPRWHEARGTRRRAWDAHRNAGSRPAFSDLLFVLLRRLAQGEYMIGDVGKRDAALRVANEHAGKENVGAHRPRTRCMILCWCFTSPPIRTTLARENLIFTPYSASESRDANGDRDRYRTGRDRENRARRNRWRPSHLPTAEDDRQFRNQNCCAALSIAREAGGFSPSAVTRSITSKNPRRSRSW
jgi:hypothetical protein